MKRKFSLILALTLSLLIVFGSIAKAKEIKLPISVSRSESTKLEAVKNPVAKTNKADSPLPQTKTCDRVLQQEKQMNDGEDPQQCNVPCPVSGRPGYWVDFVCVVC